MIRDRDQAGLVSEAFGLAVVAPAAADADQRGQAVVGGVVHVEAALRPEHVLYTLHGLAFELAAVAPDPPEEIPPEVVVHGLAPGVRSHSLFCHSFLPCPILLWDGLTLRFSTNRAIINTIKD